MRRGVILPQQEKAERFAAEVPARGESGFPHDLYDRKRRDPYTLTPDIEKDRGYGQRIFIARKTLQFERDEVLVRFTRK